MSSDVRYTFFAEFSFTPNFLREFKASGNIFLEISIFRRKTHLFTPSLIAPSSLLVHIIPVKVDFPNEILILSLKAKGAYIAYLFLDELVN